jgi:hypothetical protein
MSDKNEKIFVNFTNHPSEKWGIEQKKAASQYGEIKDLVFPDVDPDSDETSIRDEAAKYVSLIQAMNPAAVMCQGEFTLTYAVVRMLTGRGIRCVAACSRRLVENAPDGAKIVRFEFTRFREY